MDTLPDFKLYADRLADVARWAYRKGWAPGTSTNYSVRLPNTAAPAFCAITGSGVDKELIDPEHVLAIDRQGRPLNGSLLRPSAETPLHLMLYRAVGAGAVLHTHSMAAALLSKIDAPRGHVVLSGWELLEGLDGITTHDCEVNLPIFPNSQDMRSLAALIEPRLAANQLCYGFLLAGHGLYAWGKDLQEAKRHLEVFEFLLRCEQEARRHGQPTSARQESVSYSGT